MGKSDTNASGQNKSAAQLRHPPPRPADHDGAANNNWLLVEFTASLLQLKELNLKCKTIVEQPLIEHESVQVLSLSTSPFIQANQEQLGQAKPNRPSMYNIREPGAARNQAPAGAQEARYQSSIGLNNYDYDQQQRRRSNVIRMRQSQQQQQQRSRSVPASTLSPLLAALNLLAVLHLAYGRRQRQRRSNNASGRPQKALSEVFR